MNALKHGLHMTKFNRLSEQAGRLAMCQPCGDAQQIECRQDQTCHLQDHLILAYHKAHSERDLKSLEEVNVVQLATLDLVFNQRLRSAMERLGDKEEFFDKKLGRTVVREAVSNEEIYMLINMMNALKKSPADMMLTRATQENIDVEWAKLLEAEIDREQAEEHKRRILDQMNAFRAAREEASEAEKQDRAIQAFISQDGKEHDGGAPRTSRALPVGRSPFGGREE